MPRLSVIMGVYNSKSIELLKKSIHSIIDQTFVDWEFIICNDGSTDNTLSILEEIEMMDSRIKVVTYEENRGLSSALNYALSFTTGEYIARQDDDDISYPERFQVELKFLSEHPEIGFVGCLADIYDDDGIWGTYYLEERPTAKSFLWSNPFIHPSVMIRKEVFEKAGGYRIAWETRRAEDYDLFMRFYATGYKGWNIQKKLYKYRVANGNQKHRKIKDRIQEAVVRAQGYKKLGLGIKSVPYVVKPIIITLIPRSVFKRIKNVQYKNML
ncbi:MAG: beta(1,3)galactosyltransferase EpsH [Firmicutes bacterium HGW-Firmicutes-4]|jgi:glycosyltransferase involved in cell wall biosynthesis|nr:MAG: beta(1,3)galactosyltransferase EpsH [Firmicutes bacterium HGW-Firmicutes-4]